MQPYMRAAMFSKPLYLKRTSAATQLAREAGSKPARPWLDARAALDAETTSRNHGYSPPKISVWL